MSASPKKRVFITVVGHKRADAEAYVATMSENGVNHFGIGRLTIDADFVLHLRATDDLPADPTQTSPFLGYIFVFNSHTPDHFWEVRARLHAFQQRAAPPFVIAALRPTPDEGYTEQTLRAALQINAEIPLLTCIRNERESCTRVMLALLYQIVEAMAEADRKRGHGA